MVQSDMPFGRPKGASISSARSGAEDSSGMVGAASRFSRSDRPLCRVRGLVGVVGVGSAYRRLRSPETGRAGVRSRA